MLNKLNRGIQKLKKVKLGFSLKIKIQNTHNNFNRRINEFNLNLGDRNLNSEKTEDFKEIKEAMLQQKKSFKKVEEKQEQLIKDQKEGWKEIKEDLSLQKELLRKTEIQENERIKKENEKTNEIKELLKKVEEKQEETRKEIKKGNKNNFLKFLAAVITTFVIEKIIEPTVDTGLEKVKGEIKKQKEKLSGKVKEELQKPQNTEKLKRIEKLSTEKKVSKVDIEKLVSQELKKQLEKKVEPNKEKKEGDFSLFLGMGIGALITVILVEIIKKLEE